MNKATLASEIVPVQSLTDHHKIQSMIVSSDGQVIAALQNAPRHYYVPVVWNRLKNTVTTTEGLPGFESESTVTDYKSLTLWPTNEHLLMIGRYRQPREISVGSVEGYEPKQIFRNWRIGDTNYTFPFLNTVAALEISEFAIAGDKVHIAFQARQDLYLLYTYSSELEKITLSNPVSNWWHSSLVFSPNDKLLAWSPNGHTLLVDVESKEIVTDIYSINHSLEFHNKALAYYTPGIFDEQWAYAFSPTGEHLVTHNRGRIFIWTTNPFFILTSIAPPFPMRDSGGYVAHFTAAAYTPDGNILVTGQSDGSVCFWETLGYTLVAKRGSAHGGEVHTIKFTNSGNEIFTAGGSNIVIWSFNIAQTKRAG